MQKLKKTKHKHNASEEYEGSYYFDHDEAAYRGRNQTQSSAKAGKKKKTNQSDASYTATSNSVVTFSPNLIQPGSGYQLFDQTTNLSDHYESPQNERTRLVSINEAFEILRVNIPTFPYERRLSKIDTLHLAISYINLLECVLESNMTLNDYLQAYIDYKSCRPNQQTMVKPLWDSSGKQALNHYINYMIRSQ
jgi:hypothetical protein